MTRFTVAAKIWLSIGVFVLSFVFSAVVRQVQGRRAEAQLHLASESLFPAAMRAQRAEAAFQRSVKAFSDAVIMQDRTGLERGATEAASVLENVRLLARVPGLPAAYVESARQLASRIQSHLVEERQTYGLATQPGGMTAAIQARMTNLANANASVHAAVQDLKDRISDQLQLQLSALQTESAWRRRLDLWVLISCLAVSALLVELIIRYVITPPLARAQADLAHERDLLRILLDNIPDYIYFKDTASRFIRVNKAESLLLGIRKESEAVGRTDFDFFEQENARKSFEKEQEIVRTGRAMVSKVEHVSSSGFARWLSSTKVPVKDASGNVHLIVGVSRDFTDWKEAVEALQKSEESFRSLFAAIPHPVWVYDAQTLEILEVNEAATHRYGYSNEEFRRLRLIDLWPEDEPRVPAHLLPRVARQPELNRKHRTKTGEVMDVELGTHEFDFRGRQGVLVVAQDVTERKRLEVELHQAQRLESVGQLAAGIAHEINTPIQYVGDNLRFAVDAFELRQKVLTRHQDLQRAVEQGGDTATALAALQKAIVETEAAYLQEEVPKALGQSLDGVERVAVIVRAMKEFAHPGQMDKVAADINKAMQNTLLVARNEYKYVADVVTDFGDLPPVVCCIAEMSQVFLNLLVNAAHAICEAEKENQDRGTITVQTRLVDNRAIISVSDTGCGIAPEIRERVFDPFFTTKPVGHGTGQGLAIARSIVVERHGGSIRFEPNGTRGTTFVVSLPLEPPAPALRDGIPALAITEV